MSVFDIKNLSQETNESLDKPLIMLVDDEIENINVLRQLLEADFQIIAGLNGSEALSLIENMLDPEKIQLIICDQRMPELTGIEFFEKISDILPDTIRIILTGYSDTQVIIDSINKVKLYKFMTKPFEPVELLLTVQRGIEAFQMRQKLTEYTANLEKIVIERTEELTLKNKKLSEALSNLEQLSLFDQLTNAYNRHFLNEFMLPELEKFKRDNVFLKNIKNVFGYIIIDIDNFKYINDTYGHDAGDKVLIMFTQILKASCRKYDWVVRWGGEEFVIIAKGLTLKGLQRLAERVRHSIELHKFDLGCDQFIFRTCSIGITSFPFIKNKSDALTWEQTLNLADRALYVAKNNGKNTWISLFDKNITQADTFYKDAMTNLKVLVEKQLISYNSPMPRNKVKF